MGHPESENEVATREVKLHESHYKRTPENWIRYNEEGGVGTIPWPSNLAFRSGED